MAANNYDGEYLSQSGLDTLWAKIKSVFLKKTDAGTTTVTLNFADYFELDSAGHWSCTDVPPLISLIIDANKRVVFDQNGRLYRLCKYLYNNNEQVYTFEFAQITSNVSMDCFTITIPSSSSEPSEVTIDDKIIRIAAKIHPHGGLANDGTDGQTTHDTTKFFRSDGMWVAPENVEKSVYSESSFEGIKFCTTKINDVSDTSAKAYAVFSFSVVNTTGSIGQLSPSLIKPSTGIIQILHTIFTSGTATAEYRLHTYQPDSTIGLTVMYIDRGDGTLDWYLVSIPSTTRSSMSNTRSGFYLMHKNEVNGLVTPLEPEIITSLNNSGATVANGSTYKTPVLLANGSGVGAANQPVYLSGGKFQTCTMYSSSSTSTMLHELFPNSMASEGSPIFCCLNQNWVKGGYLTRSDAKAKINGTTIGGSTRPVYIDSSGNITACSNTIGSLQEHIWMQNGVLKVGGVWWRTTLASSQVDLISASPYSSAPIGGIAVISNTGSSSIDVIYKTGSSNTIGISPYRNRIFMKVTTSQWGWAN